MADLTSVQERGSVMEKDAPADIRAIEEQLDAAERDAQALVAGLTEEQGAWHPLPGSWSVTECLDHLAITNRTYLAAMGKAAARARVKGRLRRGPARPGRLGRWFASTL